MKFCVLTKTLVQYKENASVGSAYSTLYTAPFGEVDHITQEKTDLLSLGIQCSVFVLAESAEVFRIICFVSCWYSFVTLLVYISRIRQLYPIQICDLLA